MFEGFIGGMMLMPPGQFTVQTCHSNIIFKQGSGCKVFFFYYLILITFVRQNGP